MHLGVLVENMRREGYEFAVGKPHVILKDVDGTQLRALRARDHRGADRARPAR